MEVKPLRQSSVRAGYKRTEVGVIPEEWDVEPCRRVSKVITVGIVVKPTQYYQKHGVPALRSANVRENQIDKSDLIFISERANAQQAKSQVRAGDVVTVRTGYPGTSAVVPPDMAGSNCIDILITRPTDHLDSTFLSAWINSPRGKDQVLRSQNGLAQQHFNVGELRELLVALPPLPEQRAIAEALSDADGLLGGLDRLIAKKRDLKQAAMQQLLTGQTRLPGFHGEWEKIRFADLADKSRPWSIVGGPFGSNLKASDYTEEGVRIIQLQNIGDGRFLDGYAIYTSEAKADELLSNNIFPGEIILSKMGDPVARACLIPNAERRYLMASDGIRLVVDPRQFETRFVLEYINSPYFRQRAIDSSTGSTRQRIGMEDLKRLPFVKPTLAEQAAIAEVLTEMDGELAGLEQRREKTCALKQAMMQELLTGRTRLV